MLRWFGDESCRLQLSSSNPPSFIVLLPLIQPEYIHYKFSIALSDRNNQNQKRTLLRGHRYRGKALFWFVCPHHPRNQNLVHSAQKKNPNFIVFAEMMKTGQKIVDFFSIKVYLRIKIWIQNQISKIINQKDANKIFEQRNWYFHLSDRKG